MRKIPRTCAIAAALVAFLRLGDAWAGDAARPVLAVLKFQDETGRMVMQGGVGRAFGNMLASELAARNRFIVVERRKLNAVIEEQNLMQAGLLAPGNGARIGQLTGAQYLVMGTVTAYEEAGSTRMSIGLPGVRMVGGSKRDYLALDLRVVDTTTGEIAYSRAIEGEAKRTDAALATPVVGARGSGGASESRAIRAAALEAIGYLECAMVVRDDCLARYDEKDRRRLEGTRKALKIEGERSR